jgi:hypothetical protein
LPLVAEAAGQITGRVALRLILVANSQPVDIDIRRALGHEVEFTANAAGARV